MASSILLKVKMLRESLRIAQICMSEMLNMDQSAYSRIETGETELTLQKFLQIAQALQVKAEDLLVWPIDDLHTLIYLSRSNKEYFSGA